MKLRTNMAGFRRWINAHPKKNLKGWFIVNGKPLSHNEVLKVIDYCIEHGYKTEDDLPEDELAALLSWQDEPSD